MRLYNYKKLLLKKTKNRDDQAEQRHEQSESETCVRQNHTFVCKRERCRLMRGAETSQARCYLSQNDTFLRLFGISQKRGFAQPYGLGHFVTSTLPKIRLNDFPNCHSEGVQRPKNPTEHTEPLIYGLPHLIHSNRSIVRNDD